MKNLIIALVFFMTNLVLAAAEEEIEISSGKISGITLDSGVRAFLGKPVCCGACWGPSMESARASDSMARGKSR